MVGAGGGFSTNLAKLCPAFLDRLDGLPHPPRDALTTAFGLAIGEPPDRFTVGLAVLSLWPRSLKTGRWHRGLGGQVVPGERTSRSSCGRPDSSGGLAPGRLYHVPRRDLRGAASPDAGPRVPGKSAHATGGLLSRFCEQNHPGWFVRRSPRGFTVRSATLPA